MKLLLFISILFNLNYQFSDDIMLYYIKNNFCKKTGTHVIIWNKTTFLKIPYFNKSDIKCN